MQRDGYVSSGQWNGSQKHGFVTRRDLRDLLVIEHPWKPSRAGGFGAWETRVAPPKGWRPGAPLFASFYQSDNYSGAWKENAWMGTQAFIGHRFKQLQAIARTHPDVCKRLAVQTAGRAACLAARRALTRATPRIA